MKPLKAIIVEDNAFMATVLSDLLQQDFPVISVAGIAHTGSEALQLIRTLKPDVVFLDIELPDMTGFELLEQIENISFQTIFTTSHSHYAIKAFRFNALDYLEKPIRESELKEAIARISNPTSKDDISLALQNLGTKSIEDQKLVLPTQTGTLRFALKHITHIEGERNYSYLHLSNGARELSSKHLAYFEDILVDKNFFRCHRSYLINQYHVTELQNDAFILRNGVIIPISRRKRADAGTRFLEMGNDGY